MISCTWYIYVQTLVRMINFNDFYYKLLKLNIRPNVLCTGKLTHNDL